MENFKALKFLCAVEKNMNIHRDYLYLSKKKRVFITFMLIMETIIYVLVWVDNMSFLQNVFSAKPAVLTALTVFQSLYTLQSVYIILFFAPRFGREFRSILLNLSYSHEVIKYYLPYQNFLSRLKFKCWIIVAIYVGVRIPLNIAVIFSVVYKQPVQIIISMPSCILYYTSAAWSEARYSIEFLMFFCLLAIIKNVLKAVSVLMREVDVASLEHNLNDFVTVYRRLLDSVRQIKKSFSHHILFLLFMAGTHVIVLVYRVISLLLTERQLWFLQRPHILWHTLMYCVIYTTVAKSGQDVRNEVSKLLQTLARIRIKLLSDSDAPVHQGLKDLQRLVSVHPLTIELLPTMPVGMYFLPAILSLTVNNIIVTLQLNHDI